jgi:hypothetical protein
MFRAIGYVTPECVRHGRCFTDYFLPTMMPEDAKPETASFDQIRILAPSSRLRQSIEAVDPHSTNEEICVAVEGWAES